MNASVGPIVARDVERASPPIIDGGPIGGTPIGYPTLAGSSGGRIGVHPAVAHGPNASVGPMVA